MDFDLESPARDGNGPSGEHQATANSTWASWNLKKLGRCPPTPSSTPDSAAMQHRQSTSIDSAVVLEDSSSMYQVPFQDKTSPPPTPRPSSRLSGFHFSPERPGSPVSDPSSPSSESGESNGWDHICIGNGDEQDAAIDEVQSGIEAVSLGSPAGTIGPDLNMDSDAYYHSDDLVERDADSDTTGVSGEETDHILGFSLPILRGINSHDVPQAVFEICRSVTHEYAERIASIVDYFGDLSGAPSDAGNPSTGPGSAGGLLYRHPSIQSDKSTEKAKGKPKPNKKRKLSDEENDEDDEDESGSIMGDPKDSGEGRGSGGAKLRCIFRARNPARFNVRDHTSCAMTMFTKFSDLRKHILNKHMADSEIVTCQRCKKGFPSRNALELHCEREACNYKRWDPEDGINSETAARIRFRGRDCGPSDEEQWKHLWQLAFPEDAHGKIEPFQFIPVLEHHELEPTFLQKLEYLKPVVQSFVPDDEQFDGLCSIIKALFESAVNDLTQVGLKMEYVNRQGSRTGSRTSRPIARVLWSNVHDRDSGIGLDSSEMVLPKASVGYPPVATHVTTEPGPQGCAMPARLNRQPALAGSVRLQAGIPPSGRQQQLQPNPDTPPIQTQGILNGFDMRYSDSQPCPVSTSSASTTTGLLFCPATTLAAITTNNLDSSQTDYRFFPGGLSPPMHETMHIDPAQLHANYHQVDDINSTMGNGIAGYTSSTDIYTLKGAVNANRKWI
ncbi:hypothetical protein QBC40DRAFT_352336 [Triangularia verruculosa]|uniref:C2H2-type domain-containing protein n=1 Tax=Triangularia verruculosa TaxID=2587418 RepID=A0AAN6XDB0_9PEZI|nr:hypothetical protein QBC40DRAFT_352336 [Triangularia verruculosa]